MTEAPKSHKKFIFGEFQLEDEPQILWCDGKEIHLPKRPFRVLAYLIENRLRVVSRDELLEKFWDGHEVYDDALRKTVGAIRKALNDLEKPPRFIETRYGSGFRFIGAVEELENSVNKNEYFTHLAAQAGKINETNIFENSRQGFRYILVSVLVISFISLIALGFYTFRQPQASTNHTNLLERAAKKHSIAVLPLKNLTGDTSNDYLSDGVTESLINELSRIEDLKVISRSSVFEFKNKDTTPQEIGEKLDVETILEGSLKLMDEKIRVEVRLVNTKDGSVVWSSDLKEENQRNIFALQDAIVCQLVTDLKVKICGDIPPAERYTKNVKAYRLYLQGLFYRNVASFENLKKANAFFEEALQVEPDYALAHEGLATSYMVMEFNNYVQPGTAAPKALFHAEKALQQDDQLAGAYIALGAVKTLHNYDLAERERYYNQALLKNPNHRTALLWRSNIYLARGEFERAEAEIFKAREIDPLSFGVGLSLTELYLFWRKPDQAIEQANLILATRPNDEFSYFSLSKAYLQKNDIETALSYLDKAPTYKVFRDIIAARRDGNASTVVQKYADSEEGKKLPYLVAASFAYIGEKEKAFEWLEKAYAMRQADLISLKIEPNFDFLRDDPRYQDLLGRINLSGE